MRTYQHKTLQGQNLKTKSLVTLGNQSRVWGQFCNLYTLHTVYFLDNNNPLTEPLSGDEQTTLGGVSLVREIHLSFLRGGMECDVECDGLITVSSAFQLRTALQLSQVYETFEASWFVNQQLPTLGGGDDDPEYAMNELTQNPEIL